MHTRSVVTRSLAAISLAALIGLGFVAPVAPVAPVLTSGTSGSSAAILAQRKAAIDAAKAQANATYEADSATVQQAATAYAAASAALPGAQQDLADADGTVISASATLRTATTDAANAQAAADAANVSLAAAEQRVLDQRAAITDLVTAVYQGSPFLGVNALLSGGTPGQVLDGVGYASQILGTQRQTLASFTAARMASKDELNVATDEAQKAIAARESAATALTQSQVAEVGAQHATDALATLAAQRQAALVVAQKNKATTLAQYQELQRESDQVAAQLAAVAKKDGAEPPARSKKSGGTTKSSGSGGWTIGSRAGYFIMPIHGWKSSNFGMRYDPIYRRWQLHAGVDIAAGGGTPIHAAKAGRVIRAGWDGGYGNYTCIDNGLYKGSEIATCYGHQSRILVHPGQHVALGQVIGLVGETGAATGYHLHFEVRINGRPVQPLNWLPRCFC